MAVDSLLTLIAYPSHPPSFHHTSFAHQLAPYHRDTPKQRRISALAVRKTNIPPAKLQPLPMQRALTSPKAKAQALASILRILRTTKTSPSTTWPGRTTSSPSSSVGCILVAPLVRTELLLIVNAFMLGLFRIQERAVMMDLLLVQRRIEEADHRGN